MISWKSFRVVALLYPRDEKWNKVHKKNKNLHFFFSSLTFLKSDKTWKNQAPCVLLYPSLSVKNSKNCRWLAREKKEFLRKGRIFKIQHVFHIFIHDKTPRNPTTLKFHTLVFVSSLFQCQKHSAFSIMRLAMWERPATNVWAEIKQGLQI